MVLGMLLLSACAIDHFDQEEKSADYYYSLLMDASRYVYVLKDGGQLPGVSKDEHGQFDIFSEHLWDSRGQVLKRPITFPVIFTANLTPSQGTTKYRYKISKANKHANWQFDGAWMELTDGKLIDLKK